jgi:hypothetical protein
MATFTISVPCGSDTYPYDFCLIYGSSDCVELISSYSCTGTTTTTTTTTTSTTTTTTTVPCVLPTSPLEATFYYSASSVGGYFASSFSMACTAWNDYIQYFAYEVRTFTVNNLYRAYYAPLVVGERIYLRSGSCEGIAEGFYWTSSNIYNSVQTIVQIGYRGGVSKIVSIDTCVAFGFFMLLFWEVKSGVTSLSIPAGGTTCSSGTLYPTTFFGGFASYDIYPSTVNSGSLSIKRIYIPETFPWTTSSVNVGFRELTASTQTVKFMVYKNSSLFYTSGPVVVGGRDYCNFISLSVGTITTGDNLRFVVDLY